MDALLAERDAAKAKDSLSGLILRMSRRDLIDADIGRIDAASGGSLWAKAGLLRERRLSSDFADFLDSLILVLDLRPEKAFGDSIAALRSQAQDLASYPEAQYWIGRVYLAEGELRLAELQFQRAYAERASLEIPDDRFTFLYDLASLYKTASNWIGFETCLLEIVAEDPLFGDDKSFLRSAMERTLTGSGYDLFFALYREEDGPWTAAERELGEFYLESGRPQALIHLAAASGGCLRTAAGRIAKLNPSWEYASLAELLDRVQADRELPAFAQDASLWQNLYELGLALDAAGNRAGARDIWKALAGRKIGPWAANANRALGLTGPKR
jgi:tetratricopeptide (TPR) repeat protein